VNGTKLYFPLIFCGALLAGNPAPTESKTDAALRKAATNFYTLLVQHKYREAEDYIAPESRDAYYEAEKPSIQDFAILKITVDPSGKSAIVSVSSHSKVRRPMFTGEITLKTGQESHWVLQNGKWLWVIQTGGAMQTPFGPMRVNADQAQGTGLDLKAAIAKGPKPTSLPAPYAVDKREVTLPAGSTPQVITITNKLTGPTKISFQIAGGSGFDCTLKKFNLAAGESTELLVYRSRTKKELVPGAITINSYPIPQTILIQVKVE
jgi:hypothetical protein